MPKLLFFSRVAFICNLCFFITFLLQYSTWVPSQALSSTIIILGNVFALFVNAAVNIIYGIVLIRRQSIMPELPRWLIIANFLFFIIQIILLLR